MIIPVESMPTDAEIKAVIDRAFGPTDHRLEQIEAAVLALDHRLELERRRAAYHGRHDDDQQLADS